MDYKEFIGVDVSKLTLDYHASTSKKDQKIENSITEIKRFLKIFTAKYGNDILVLCEATGGYEKLLVDTCHQENIDIIIAQPRQARSFAKALNLHAKTDKIDAQILSLFAQKMGNKLVKSVSYPENEMLRSLVRRRNELVDHKVAIGNKLDKVYKEGVLAFSYQEELESIKRLIKQIEVEILSYIKQSHMVKEQFALLQSIQGIGPKTAYEIIAELPEILDLTPNQLSALAGLAPMNRDSGKYCGKRRIQGGRKQVRKALYMAAVTAIRYENDLKKIYDRLIKNGKPFKVAISAICRKILLMAQAVLKRKSPWKAYIAIDS